jgi:hypothetical protein
MGIERVENTLKRDVLDEDPIMASRKKTKRRPGKQGSVISFVLMDEVDYIRSKAAQRIGCVVAVGPLILFSAESGDAWLLDRTDHLAARLAREGDDESVYIEETEKNFAIGWKGEYQINGDFFIYVDHESGSVVTILGYPTKEVVRLG